MKRTIFEPSNPTRYFPLEQGRYEVKPGLFPFGTDFGNREADRRVFQIDASFERYRGAKLEARRERLSKYYRVYAYPESAGKRIASFIVERLTLEHPAYFRLDTAHGQTTVYCALTEESLVFDSEFRLRHVHSGTAPPSPPYESALDALACQVPEDLAVVILPNASANYLAAVHLCHANHWGAEDKIGQDFAAVHAPVPGMGKINRSHGGFMAGVLRKGPFVRFGWGLATDSRLNHHPKPPLGVAASQWHGRRFDPAHPRLYLRVERQTLCGFPETDTVLFTIRTYFMNCADIKQELHKLEKLKSAILSMDARSLEYKGLAGDRDAILEWLDG